MEATSPSRTTGARHINSGQHVTVRVPGSSGNVGPGFDTMGLALGLYDRLTVTTGGESGTVKVEVAGEGADQVPADDTHLIIQVMKKVWRRTGFTAGGLSLRADNAIPHGRGLGSSAAAIVSGALAANALLPAGEKLDDEALFQLCVELEGHPDNVAPSLYGGLSISWHAGSSFRTAPVDVLAQVVPVVAIPDAALSTETARSLLPNSVSHMSAAANSGRTALLVHALTTDPSYLLEGTEDSLHQGYRASAMPDSAALMNSMRAAGFAAAVSGAGPTVLVLANGDAQAQEAKAELAGLLTQNGLEKSWRVMNLKVAREGAKVEVHQR
ncbi:MAG TPA: homoserine kinase [Arthrobacter sp.]|nr:homoserine kinase [Arthrobacter sp.]